MSGKYLWTDNNLFNQSILFEFVLFCEIDYIHVVKILYTCIIISSTKCNCYVEENIKSCHCFTEWHVKWPHAIYRAPMSLNPQQQTILLFVNIIRKWHSIVLIWNSLVITEVEYYFIHFWLFKQTDMGGEFSKGL